jgi:CRISPR-associated protein Csa3
MRTYVSTLGFHETRVTRPVLRHGLDDSDVVVLLRPKLESSGGRGEDAVGYVEDMLQEVAPGVSIETERVPTGEFTDAVLTCSDVILAANGDLILNFGGGAREVLLPFAVAGILHAPHVDAAFQYTDVEQEVEPLSVPNLTAEVPENTWPTLEAAVNENSASIATLASATGKSKSTISRHVTALVDTGVLQTDMDGQTKVVNSTPTAELLWRAESEQL